MLDRFWQVAKRETVIECVQSAGQILLESFGRRGEVRRKQDLSNVVTEADLASEAHLLELIRRRYPAHNILAEENGWLDRGSGWTWVIDPLDGTSNFAAGLPWFGVMVAVFDQNQPVHGAMYLPCANELYVAEQGQGAWRNGQRLHVTDQADLGNLLWSYMMDYSPDEELTRRRVLLLGRLLGRVRNVRCTNSLVDFAATIDGRLGGFINHSAKIWDIASAWLLLQEAGGRMTDLRGGQLQFHLGPAAVGREYAVMGASLPVLEQVTRFIGASGFFPPAQPGT